MRMEKQIKLKIIVIGIFTFQFLTTRRRGQRGKNKKVKNKKRRNQCKKMPRRNSKSQLLGYLDSCNCFVRDISLTFRITYVSKSLRTALNQLALSTLLHT